MTTADVQHFFEEFTGEAAQEFLSLAPSGSSRMNFLATSSGKNYILTFNENIAENESFFYFSEVFSELKLNTPEIFSISGDRKLYIQEYLGAQTLSEIIAKESLSDRTESLVKRTLEKLFTLQTASEGKIDYSKTFEYERYDELPITNDLFYFKSFIADVLEIPYHKSSLLSEFRKLVSYIEKAQPQGLMLRDFQARNIMVNDSNEVFFIDYQAAMKGPLMYDVISFLFQAKANFPENFKNEMLTYYFSFWKDEGIKSDLQNSVKILQLVRYLQVLGAYGFRGLIQKKEHFKKSLAQGIENLHEFSNTWDEMKDYPELQKIINYLKTEDAQKKIENLL